MRFIPILALVAALATQATAAPLQYDHQQEVQQERMLRLYVRTRTCLGDAARAILRRGVRDSAVVQHFMVRICGNAFAGLLQADGMAEEQARRTVIDLARIALYEDVLRQPIPFNQD